MDTLALGLPNLDSALAIAKVVLGFGLVIFIHEFGHFIMARRNGVFVEKFAIGFDFFGAKLFRWRSKGTEYVVGAFPIGGYVKMKGQHDLPGDEEEQGGDEDSFQSKTVWQRTQIISAGVIANFLSAFVLCYLALVLGYHAFPAEIGQVSYADLEAGLKPGDRVVEMAGKSVATWEEMLLIYATQEAGTDIPVRVVRDGSEFELGLPVHRDSRLPINYPEFSSGIETKVGILTAGLPADRAGVLPGDDLVAIDGQAIESWGDFRHLVRRRAETPMRLTVERGGPGKVERLELEVVPQARASDRLPRYHPGFEPAHPPILDYVEEGGPGWKAGLRPGDLVLAVAGKPVGSWYSLWQEATWGVPEGRPVPLTIQRGAADPLLVSVERGNHANWAEDLSSLSGLRLAGRPPESVVVGSLDERMADSPLQPGDVVVSVKGVLDMPDGTEGE
ncbi:MAG: RIP metalloprotease RseP, partial [Myxococcota bacterium]|nr:RIP metalloprotease RseP [Myxococcota bacterium]